MRLTGLHEVAVSRISTVAENVVFDGIELSEVPEKERMSSACCAVVVNVGELDATIDEESQSIRRQVHGQHDEVDPVVVVQ